MDHNEKLNVGRQLSSSEKKIPDAFKNLEHWETNRRTVLKAALLAGAMTQIGLFTSCSTPQLKAANDLLTAEQATILSDILIAFFPDDGNGPSAKDINAFEYFMWVLHDNLNRKVKDNAYIIDGLNWTEEASRELYFSKFVDLNEKQKAALIDHVTQLDWGRNWSSVVITLLLEALLLDPIYGGNTNEAGWKWLNHTVGLPRPTEELRYERIMEKQMKIKSQS